MVENCFIMSQPDRLQALYDCLVIKCTLRWRLDHTRCVCHANDSEYCEYDWRYAESQDGSHKKATVYGSDFNGVAAHVEVWCKNKPSIVRNLLDMTHLLIPGQGDYIKLCSQDQTQGQIIDTRICKVKRQYVMPEIPNKFSNIILTDPKNKSKQAFITSIKQAMIARVQQIRINNMPKYGKFCEKDIKKVVDKCALSNKTYFDTIWDFLLEEIYIPEWGMFWKIHI